MLENDDAHGGNTLQATLIDFSLSGENKSQSVNEVTRSGLS